MSFSWLNVLVLRERQQECLKDWNEFQLKRWSDSHTVGAMEMRQ